MSEAIAYKEFGDEFCPQCAQWKPLIQSTGWCLTCTRRLHPGLCFCDTCGREFTNTNQFRNQCPSCSQTDWIARNADRIELYIGAGLTYEMAVARVSYDNRPICRCCGKKIKGGTDGRHLFCKTTAECRTAARRYKYYKEQKGMKRDTALAAVLETLVK